MGVKRLNDIPGFNIDRVAAAAGTGSRFSPTGGTGGPGGRGFMGGDDPTGAATGGNGKSGGGPLITCRTSMGMFSGTPPGPGAAEARAAMAYACSVVSTDTIQ